jgi:hypothetical protein
MAGFVLDVFLPRAHLGRYGVWGLNMTDVEAGGTTARGGVIHRVMPLGEARTHVDGWLDEVKLKTGRCSEIMRNEIAEGMRQRTISAFAVYDEIGQMEQSDPPRRSGTKLAKPLTGELLAGLMHKHYKTASMQDFMLNIENHWRRRDNRVERQRIEDEVRNGGHTGKAAHEIVLGGYQARHGGNQMTGEWIVYAVVDGVNYYLTLSTHGEPDSAIRERVKNCFDEFPELAAHLGW